MSEDKTVVEVEIAHLSRQLRIARRAMEAIRETVDPSQPLDSPYAYAPLNTVRTLCKQALKEMQ